MGNEITKSIQTPVKCTSKITENKQLIYWNIVRLLEYIEITGKYDKTT